MRPNHLTLAAAPLMLTAAAIVALGGAGYLPSAATALALAAALVLDTSRHTPRLPDIKENNPFIFIVLSILYHLLVCFQQLMQCPIQSSSGALPQ